MFDLIIMFSFHANTFHSLEEGREKRGRREEGGGSGRKKKGRGWDRVSIEERKEERRGREGGSKNKNAEWEWE